jgi:hypothetical protein
MDVGGGIVGSIGSASQRCSYRLNPPNSGVLEGPCQIIRVLGLKTGSLDVHLTWDANVPLTLASAGGESSDSWADAVCCHSPLDLVAPIFVYDVTPIFVVYTGQSRIEDVEPIQFVVRNKIHTP